MRFGDAIALAGRSSGAPPAMQEVGPSALLDVPATVLAVLAFVLVVSFGGGVIYFAGGRIDAAVDASMDNPLISVVYGVIAYGLVVFLVGYAYSQLARLGVAANTFATLTLLVFGVLILSLSAFGFVVVGAWLTSVVGGRNPWVGLVAVGGLCALAWLVLPTVLAAVVWVAVAGVGVGGPTRRWIHADETEPVLG
ncbi:hypothetical protein [Halomarina rubra]|uniref:Yip1 domain-containing protein n=1 Tax=Halomarina rubra TaxID=2071873 RepID=A0ABD6AXG9_9EURY|nr:hypothetical protein [Halomarina rubra]